MAGRRAGSIVIRSLVPIQSTDERDYARLSVDIEVRKRQMAQLQAERDKLELALSRFAVDLKNRVGGVRTELNRVRLQTAEYRRRIERLKHDESLDPATVEREVAEEFADRREAARIGEEFSQRERQRVDRAPRRTPRLNVETEAEILRVYRELAKRFHPDLARTDPERTRRSGLMLRINVAYSDRDLLALQSIAREAQAVDPRFAGITAGERVVWAHRVIARLDSQIEDVEAQLGTLRRSETFSLWKSPETSHQSIADLEARVRARLTRERDRLDEAILDYNRIVRRRRMPRAGAGVGPR